MSLDEFLDSLGNDKPSYERPPALRALWHAHRGEWNTAHEIVQRESDRECALVHAYLHRQEGDTWNAKYWYSRAGRSPFGGTLEEEWRALVEECLSAARSPHESGSVHSQ